MIIIAEVSELTRKIKLPTDRVLSVNGDYQVDGIAFKLPATYEGDFDFSTAAARVHWTGVDKVEHTNLITEVDGNGYPLWVMPSELTQGGHGVIEFAVSFVATDATAAVTKRWISDPVSFRNRRTVNGSNEDEEAEEEKTYDRLASAIAAVRAAQASVDDVAEVLSSLGTLTFHFVDAKADMTDQTKLYVLTTDGYLYYYSTAASDFVPAFEVGGSQEVIDARTDENGTTYANLKTRINTGFTQLKEDLSEQLELVVSKKEPEIVQLVDLSKLDWVQDQSAGTYQAFPTDFIKLKGDGDYYQNPSGGVSWRFWYARFCDAEGNTLTLTNANNGSTQTYLTLFGAPENNGHFTIENGRTLKYYQGNTLTNTYTTEADIAKMAYTNPNRPRFGNFASAVTQFGITYGGKSASYVPYNSKGYVFGYSQELTDQINEQIDTKLDDTFNTSSATPENVGQAIIVQSVDANGNATFKYGEAGSKITVPEYNAKNTYPVGSYVMHDNTIQKSIVPIMTPEAWDATHWTEITVSDMIADMNKRLDMLVTMQEVQEDEPVEGIVQVVDLSKLNWTANSQGKYSGKLTDYIILKGDGDYYQNPCGVAVNEGGSWRLIYARFYDAYNNQLTLTNVKNGSTSQHLTMFGAPENNGHFTIENGRTLKHYQGNALTNTYTTEADIAKIMGNADFQHFDNDTTKFGITYGGKSTSYVPYEGSAAPTYEYNYVPKMAEYVEEYMKVHGTAVDNNIFNYVYPEADNTEFVNAIKYYHSRKEREGNNIVRIGTFNKYVSRGSTNYPVIKEELADYSVDMCGFQETYLTISDGVITNRIETALRGWQFPHGCDVSINTGKGFVSHWEILSSEALELLTTSRGISYAIKCVVQLPEYKMYSNAINSKPTLSVYTYHGIAYNAEIDGVMTSSKQIRLMEISALLNFISEDTSDFTVIVGDTNAFESGFDIHTGTHEEWELFRQAGYTPVLSGEYSTVTEDLAAKYFTLADNNKVYCIAAYDQIFIGQNISVVATNVVDSNLYPVEALGGAPVSDHCMVYADLKFDFDAIMQNKLKDIAVTEPWW